MVYGIDQCRKCGKAMPTAGPEHVARYEQSKRQKPTMPEAEWRAQGWKAAPTRYQLHHRLDGMCGDCVWESGHRAVRYGRLMTIVLGSAAVLFVIVYLVAGVFH